MFGAEKFFLFKIMTHLNTKKKVIITVDDNLEIFFENKTFKVMVANCTKYIKRNSCKYTHISEIIRQINFKCLEHIFKYLYI